MHHCRHLNPCRFIELTHNLFAKLIGNHFDFKTHIHKPIARFIPFVRIVYIKTLTYKKTARFLALRHSTDAPKESSISFLLSNRDL